MSKSIKEIGHVIPLSSGGFAVRVVRYGSGRLLPAPRLLLTVTGKPFTSGLAALDALNAWKTDPRSCQKLVVTSATPAPVAPTPAVKRVIPPIARPEMAPKRKARKGDKKRINPPIVKLMPERPATCIPARDDVSLRIDELIASGVVEVTRCLPGQSRNYTPKHGGVLPGRLNPVTMR